MACGAGLGLAVGAFVRVLELAAALLFAGHFRAAHRACAPIYRTREFQTYCVNRLSMWGSELHLHGGEAAITNATVFRVD